MESCRPAKNSATKHELKLQGESMKNVRICPASVYFIHTPFGALNQSRSPVIREEDIEPTDANPS